jgi:hypothetical protein
MTLDVVWPELEGQAREWWAKVRDDIGEPTRRKCAFVRITPDVYVFCMPDHMKAEHMQRLVEVWKETVGKDGPKILVLGETVFVPELGEKDGDQGQVHDQAPRRKARSRDRGDTVGGGG